MTITLVSTWMWVINPGQPRHGRSFTVLWQWILAIKQEIMHFSDAKIRGNHTGGDWSQHAARSFWSASSKVFSSLSDVAYFSCWCHLILIVFVFSVPKSLVYLLPPKVGSTGANPASHFCISVYMGVWKPWDLESRKVCRKCMLSDWKELKQKNWWHTSIEYNVWRNYKHWARPDEGGICKVPPSQMCDPFIMIFLCRRLSLMKLVPELEEKYCPSFRQMIQLLIGCHSDQMKRLLLYWVNNFSALHLSFHAPSAPYQYLAKF